MKADELYAGLTPKQRRRTEMRATGMLIKDIAHREGVYQRAVCRSLELSEKKMIKNVKNYPKKGIVRPFNSRGSNNGR